MKKHIKRLQTKLKGKPRESAIKNYKAAYLDKRSKTYHKVVLTAFTGLFGLMGVIYVFGANAASDEGSNSENNDNMIVALVALALVFTALITLFVTLRKK